MLLKNLMEEKQLDFNQPLLSVRRFSSTTSTTEANNKKKTDNALPKVPPLPVYISELKSGPVRNPGTVPFVWEKTPGRSKYESKPQTIAHEFPPVVPKLPPGRILNFDKQAFDKISEGAAGGESETRIGFLGSHNAPSLDKSVTKEESSRDGMEEANVSGSEDDDEVYVDALDTLSRSESFFLNCSVSGVTGLDGPDTKTSGTFLTDPLTRDFMMGRFLPAAKAMASETPPHYTRKQPVVPEQPRKINMVSVEKWHPFNQCRRISNIPHCAQGNGVEETEDEEDGYDGSYDSSFKVCGLFPRLCLQNSFYLLNPVPGTRKQSHVPISSTCMKKAKSSHAAHYSETVNEHGKDAVHKHILRDPLEMTRKREDKNELKSELNKIGCKNDCRKLDGSSLYNRLQGNGTLVYLDKLSQSVDEEKGFLVIPEKYKISGMSGFDACAKSRKNFGELLANESNEWESASASPVVEKTLYVDSVHMLKPQFSNSSSSDMKCSIDNNRDDIETLIKNGEIEKTAFVDSSLQDMKYINAADEKTNVVTEILESADSCHLSLSDRSTNDMQMVVEDGSRHDQNLVDIYVMPGNAKVDEDGKIDSESRSGEISGNMESCNGLLQHPIKMTNTKVADNGKIDLESQLRTKLSDQDTSNSCHSLLPLPPPLPKSPSESWLKRTLPAVSSKHTSVRSSLGMNVYPRVQASKMHSPDPKWEAIVKASSAQHGHLQFSEELLAPIPEV